MNYVVLFASAALVTSIQAVNDEYCEKVNFDLSNPENAVALYKACRKVNKGRNSGESALYQKFLSSWAKYATKHGVSAAVKKLHDDEVRDILVSPNEWNGVISQLVMDGESPSSAERRFFIYQCVLAAILVVTLLVTLYFVLTLAMSRHCDEGTCRGVKSASDVQSTDAMFTHVEETIPIVAGRAELLRNKPRNYMGRRKP